MQLSSLFIGFISIASSLANLVLLPRDGVVTDKDFIGYDNINYHAVRFEPLCGSFGSINPENFFKKPVSEGGQCDQAILQYSKSTDTLAMYDLTGVKLSGAAAIVAGSGSADTAMCMCFSLAVLSGGNADICVWVNGVGQANTVFDLAASGLGYIVQSSFKPGSAKALPSCGGNVNVTSLETKWSSTAFFDTASSPPTNTVSQGVATGTTTSSSTTTGTTTGTQGTAPPPGDSSTGGQATQSTDSADTSRQTTSPGAAHANLPGSLISTIAVVVLALGSTTAFA